MAELALPRRFEAVEIAELRATLLAQPRSFWDSDAHIKRASAPRRDGNMVWLWKSKPTPDGLVTTTGSAVSLAPLALPIMTALLKNYPSGGEVVSAVLALLPAGGVIPQHRDVGALLVRSHRIHVPLVVNPAVEFLVEGEIIPLKEGEAFELPNQNLHSVRNGGSEDRIHLVFDYLPGSRSEGDELAWLPRAVKAHIF